MYERRLGPPLLVLACALAFGGLLGLSAVGCDEAAFTPAHYDLAKDPLDFARPADAGTDAAGLDSGLQRPDQGEPHDLSVPVDLAHVDGST